MDQKDIKAKILQYLSDIPFLWVLFESVFGADRQKQILYKSVYKPRYKILDFGCSVGNTTAAFTDFDYWGYDIDPKCIKYAQKRWERFSNVHFICGDILKKELAPESFDFVLFAGTGHHLNDIEIIPIFNELIRLLKERGELWFFDITRPNKNSPLTARILARIDRGRYLRTPEEYRKIIDELKFIRVSEEMVFPVRGVLIQQEDYCFFRLTKI
ncbi:MAG: class I SAM-dependent methyltransferase [Patescibacteria group bacterium]